MSHVDIKSAGMIMPNSGVERLRGRQADNLEAEKARLRKVATEFESFFTYQMLKTMRSTIPESNSGGGFALSEGAGKDVFTDLFDMELARKMSGARDGSIADILYNSMESLVEAQYGAFEDADGIRPLHEEGEPARLYRETYRAIPDNGSGILLPENDAAALPLRQSSRTASEQRIMRQYGTLIEEAARRNGLDPDLILSVIKAESNGDTRAVSRAGAKGLMQLMDSTATEYGVTDSFDPAQNIQAGSGYLKGLIDRFGDTRLALAAYNAGPANVVKHGGIPPFEETQTYVERVLDTLASVRKQQ